MILGDSMLRFNRHSFLVLVSVIGVMFVAKNYLLFSAEAQVVLKDQDDITAARNALVILKSIKQGSWAGSQTTLPNAAGGRSGTITAIMNTSLNTVFTSLKTGAYASVATNLDNTILVLTNMLPAASVDVSSLSFTGAQMQGFSGKSNDSNIKYLKNNLFSDTTSGAGRFLNSSGFTESLANTSITVEMLNSFLTVSRLLGLSINDVQASALRTAAQRGSASSTTSVTESSVASRSITSAASLLNNTGRRV